MTEQAEGQAVQAKPEKITVIAADVANGKNKRKHYASIAHARGFAIEKLGGDGNYVIKERYAESTVNDTLIMVKNSTLQAVLVDPLPAGSPTVGKKASKSKSREEILELMGIYITEPAQCEELMYQLEDVFVFYKKKIKEDAPEEAVVA